MANFYANYPGSGGGGGGVPIYPHFSDFPNATTAGAGALAVAQDNDALYVSNGFSWIKLADPSYSPNAITALNSDVTATGPGNAAATVVSVGGSTAASVHTSQLATAAATNANTPGTIVLRDGSGNFSAGTITASITGHSSLDLAVASNLSDVASASTSFKNISPLTTAGDIVFENATPTPARLPIGSTGNVLTVSGGLPAWSPPATSGTVTSVSVVTANGLAGTVATATSTPAITLTTSVTGVLKGNATAISAATAGTDYSAGTSALATGIVKSTTTTGALSIATSGTDYSAGTSGLTTGIIKSTTTTGALTIAVAADFPTLNQNTSGTSANVTGTVAIANGGTGQTTANPAFNALSPLTTKGDVLGFSTVNARLGVGTNGQTLLADSSQTLGIKWGAVTATQNGNVRASEGGGTVTLTISDNQTQTFNLSSAETVKLPTTSIAKGDIWTMINPNQQVLTVQSSGANNIIKSWGSRIILQANVATPTAAADWTVLEHVIIQGRVWTDYTPTYSTGTGITQTFLARWIRTGINAVQIEINTKFSGTNSGGSGNFTFTGPSFLQYNSTDYPDGIDSNLGGTKLTGSQNNDNGYVDLAFVANPDNTFVIYYNTTLDTWTLFPWNGFVANDRLAASFSFKSSTLSET